MGWAIPVTVRPSSDGKVVEASNADLIRSIAGRGRRALRELFVRHKLRIFRFITRLLRDESLAENLVSEVFLKVWRDAANFRGQHRISTWLLVIARKEALAEAERQQNKELAHFFVQGGGHPTGN